MHCDNGYVEISQWEPHCWINVECPDHEDVRFLIDDMKMPADFLDSIADVDENSRFDHDREWQMIILRIPCKTPKGRAPYVTVPIGIIWTQEILITVCYHKTELIDDFIEYTHRRETQITSQADFVFRLLYSSCYWYLRYLKEMNHAYAKATSQLKLSVRNDDLMILQQLQTSLVYFSTSLKGNATLVERLKHVFDNEYDPDLVDDVEIDLHQADNTVSIYMDILDSTLDTYASIISNNVNDIMKKMTGISIVLMMPTLVASFYGMNVTIQGASAPWAFWAIAGGSLAISLILYLVLRHFRWL